MNAVVGEARMWGRKVAAHAHGTEGIKRAVRAGVASIDHGTFLDEEAARMMAERGTYLVKDSRREREAVSRLHRLGHAAHGSDPHRDAQRRRIWWAGPTALAR